MDEVEVPQYFLCPISLQIMRDPVTAISGITYDRESIEQWLKAAKGTPTCPVTKQNLPRDSDLTPNLTLLRLIQAWCTTNAKNGVDRIPTQKSSLSKAHVVKLIKDLEDPHVYMRALKQMEGLAAKNEKIMVEAGADKAMVAYIIKCFKQLKTTGLEEALRLLYIIWDTSEEIKLHIKDNVDFIDSLAWIILCYQMDNYVSVKEHAMFILKKVTEVTSPRVLERLNLDLFKGVVGIPRARISQQATKSALLVLIDMCSWGRNRMKIVEANAVFELIQFELEKPEKNITELIVVLLAQLCACADGRAQFLKHAGGTAMLAKRILRVSPATDDRAIHIFDLIAKFSATDEVLLEMLRVGAVSKLCMVMQADSAAYLKAKARGILRLHSNVWNNSPCIAVYLLTRYPR